MIKIVKGWYEGLIYPFKEPDWKEKMWLIPLTGYLLTPLFQILVLRGWRVELVRRIGLKFERILPPADVQTILRYALHGIKLYLITGIYLIIPIFLFRLFGINPFRQMIAEILNILGYLWYNDTGLPLSTLIWNSFLAILWELFIENMWLAFYYPYYRAATIRYALTGKFRKSHLAFLPNVLFVVRNIGIFLMMMVNQVIDKVIIFFVNIIISIVFTPIVGAALAPLFLFYADFWTSGHEYGQIAAKMVKQEYPHLLSEYDDFGTLESAYV
ncbi:MAG TPA: hypothetical protein PKC76_06350 [Saprospiraceae bacterium]|nr:hypothetical protein [Saprospiraceae bacterium]HMP23732.1 hypothetical protein [Saprospiraceae bacterium]